MIKSATNVIKKTLKVIRGILKKPSQLNSYGPSKFLFYNHQECGFLAVNPLSPLFEAGIRRYLTSRPAARLLHKIASKLEREGVAVFSISELENGDRLFREISKELHGEMGRLGPEIALWRNGLAVSSEGDKGYLFPISIEPLWSSPSWKMAIHPQILELVNNYMYAQSKLYYLKYWINEPRLGRLPESSQMWHRDGDGTVIKLFVYISNVSKKSGPFYYACRSHRGQNRSVHHASVSRSTERASDEEFKELFKGKIWVKEITGAAGTVILANTSGYHKGGFVVEGVRHVLTAAYYCPWIDRSDYGLQVPTSSRGSLHACQSAAISWAPGTPISTT